MVKVKTMFYSTFLNFVVVGAGLSGAVIAERASKVLGLKVGLHNLPFFILFSLLHCPFKGNNLRVIPPLPFYTFFLISDLLIFIVLRAWS